MICSTDRISLLFNLHEEGSGLALKDVRAFWEVCKGFAISTLVSIMLRVNFAAGPVMGQLACVPSDPDESRAGLRGPLHLGCLLINLWIPR